MFNPNQVQAQGPSTQPEYTIIVNDRELPFTGSQISYEEVVRLAFGQDVAGMLTMTYFGGATPDHREGSMNRGDVVQIQTGTAFSVANTSHA